MKNPLVLTSILAVLLTGTATYASDDLCEVPMSKWQPRIALQSMALELGWDVRRIKIDDGCYEIYALDAEGREIEVKLNPATLAIVKFEYEDHDDDDDHDERDDHGNSYNSDSG